MPFPVGDPVPAQGTGCPRRIHALEKLNTPYAKASFPTLELNLIRLALTLARHFR